MNQEEYPTYEILSEQDRRQFLYRKGMIFLFPAGILLLAGLYWYFSGNAVFCYLCLTAGVILSFFGIQPAVFWKKEKQRDYISSRLFRMHLKLLKESGQVFSGEELDRMRFANDPLFREKVIRDIHRREDSSYARAVKDARTEVSRLTGQYERMYKQISKARWEEAAEGVLSNPTEGKLVINGTECLFSDIRGAEVNMISGRRVETRARENVREEGKEKRDLSVGGAIVGGLVAGPIGAAAGGIAFGKKHSSSSRDTVSRVVTDEIPICVHLGVRVNIGGFVSEIILIDHQVDQQNPLFTGKLREAQRIVSVLQMISASPMPAEVLAVEQEPELVLLYEDISRAKQNLAAAVDNRPTYEIPSRYRSE